MKSYKLSLILNLALILLNQFFILETKAFFNCENQSCKKNSYSRFSKEKKLIREYKQNFAVINDMTNSIWNDQEEDINTDNNNPNPGGGGSGGGGSSTGGGGRIIPPNDLAQMKACSINIQTVSIRLSYIQCQIESAIDKFKKANCKDTYNQQNKNSCTNIKTGKTGEHYNHNCLRLKSNLILAKLPNQRHRNSITVLINY